MTPESIIEQATADGVQLVLAPNGKIKASGSEGAINRWLPIIREQKPGIMAALQSVENIFIEPAAPNARPIFWERATGIAGPAHPEFLAMTGRGPRASYWVVAQFEGLPIWINSLQLRSKRQFEHQVPLNAVALVREHGYEREGA